MTLKLRSLKPISKNSLKIIELLAGSGAKVRFVGGIVRDYLLSIPTKDIDIATDFTPTQVIETLGKHKVKVIPTGIRFGTVTAIIKDEYFEITTLRRDTKCDGRHAHVEFSNDFKEDAARRDFSINALSYCPLEDKIFDYFGGLDDLNNRKVIFIGNADERIEEDYLRILRFFRFSCKYAKEIDEVGLAACIKYKDNIKLLSGERIRQEMDKLLLQEGSPHTLDIMDEVGILQIIFPNIISNTKYNQKLHFKLIEVARILNLNLPKEVIYATFLKFSLQELLDLKFSKVSAMKIINLSSIRQSINEESLVTTLKTIWLQEKSFVDYFVLAAALFQDNKFIFDLFDKLKDNVPPIFPLNSGQLIELGYRGEKLGNLIKILKSKWIESDFTLNNEALMNLIKNSKL